MKFWTRRAGKSAGGIESSRSPRRTGTRRPIKVSSPAPSRSQTTKAPLCSGQLTPSDIARLVVAAFRALLLTRFDPAGDPKRSRCSTESSLRFLRPCCGVLGMRPLSQAPGAIRRSSTVWNRGPALQGSATRRPSQSCRTPSCCPLPTTSPRYVHLIKAVRRTRR